jgi:hypothetical protein
MGTRSGWKALAMSFNKVSQSLDVYCPDTSPWPLRCDYRVIKNKTAIIILFKHNVYAVFAYNTRSKHIYIGPQRIVSAFPYVSPPKLLYEFRSNFALGCTGLQKMLLANSNFYSYRFNITLPHLTNEQNFIKQFHEFHFIKLEYFIKNATVLHWKSVCTVTRNDCCPKLQHETQPKFPRTSLGTLPWKYLLSSDVTF